MEFSFTSEQRAIEDLAAKIFEAHAVEVQLQNPGSVDAAFDAELWSTLADAGLINVVLPEEQGGVGLGMLELGLVLEQQGRTLACAPLWQHLVATLAIATHGTEALQEQLLPGLTDGSIVAAIATESGVSGDLTAQRTSDGWVLNGATLAVITKATQHVLLAAETPEGRRWFVLNLKRHELLRVAGELTDDDPIYNLGLNDITLDADAVLAAEADVWLEPRIAFCLSSLQLGVLNEALRRAAEYVSERRQFGRPLGSFQALAVRAADAYIQVELLRSACWQLAWRLDEGLPVMAAARVAKHQASEAGHMVAHTALHFHGGVGADLTHPIHRYYLKARVLESMGGSAETQLARIGQELAGDANVEYVHE